MEIAALKVFLAVIDSGSFSKAAENLGYTPAGVSYIINGIEEELGIKLIERNYSGVTLNSNGMALLQDIRRIIDAYGSFESSIHARKAKRYQTLHIATIETMSILWLPDALISFQKKCPDVNVEISTGDPFEINAWLAEGLSDVGLTERAWISAGYRWFSIAHDPFFAVFPPKSKVPMPCPIEFFRGQDFFMPNFRQDKNLPVLLTKNGVKVNNLYDSACTQAVIRSIASGRGSTILSALSLELYGGKWMDEKNAPVVAPLLPYSYRELGVSMKAELAENKIVTTFLRCLKNAAKKNPVPCGRFGLEDAGSAL